MIDACERSILSVRNLGKSFGGLRAVDDVSFDVAADHITAMIGPNGAGKTTVFNVITNIFSKDQGQVQFRGRDLGGLSPIAIAEMGLIRTFQSARVFPGMTALENAMVGAHRLTSSRGAFQAPWLPRARHDERVVQ